MTTYAFPDDLRDAQLRPHQAGAAYRRLCQALPWSAEPALGWEGDKQPYTEYRTGKPDSPGYTPEQKSEEARLRGEVLQLSITVSTHPYWRTLEAGTTVDARMALKHIHDHDQALTGTGTDERSLQSL
ncbi:hypothetical protein OG501_00035 [Streptomyces niveus]|uniref:Transposase n=1 Tax=Streptomyces niveus TaxID=193462 RepID=A0ABZ1ZZM0_STRNV|nr:hypothetical protein [Streptomyces niveus]